jgi:hypothetical protein
MKRTTIVFTAILLASAAAFAANTVMKHKPGMDHSMMMGGDAMPTEVGQSAFAAIQEIVTKLGEDPKTDWSKINIEALRQHLIDMNNVTLGADVSTTQTANGLIFKIDGNGKVKDSIQRMVLAHAGMMNDVDGWAYVAIATPDGAQLTVTAPDKPSLVRLQGLGFIGLMTSGMHHQEHHWMLANGVNPHQ